MYLYTNNNANGDDKQKGAMTAYIRSHGTGCPRKKYLSGISGFGPFWKIMDHSGFFKPLGPFRTVLGHLGPF